MKKQRTEIKFLKNSLSHLRLERPFPKEGRALRKHFEDTFRDPYRANRDRFCWDYWSIPGQYRLLRTTAESFFPKAIYNPFLSRLLHWGRENLGCQMISHPWLSAYTDGCYQNLHTDMPHGAFAFVYSLTPWRSRTFRGGETLIATTTLLNHFSTMDASRSHEERDLLTLIPPVEQQLSVFDPRFPHGVRSVQGVDSILDARLVIHGWFTEPRPMLEGALNARKVSPVMDRIAIGLLEGIPKLGSHSGLLTLRLNIEADGSIMKAEVLASHLLDRSGAVISKGALASLLPLAEFRFPKSRGKTRLTLPLEIR